MKIKKQKYSKVFVYVYDGEVFEYDLNTWKIYRDQDWIDVIKNDGTEKNSYAINNIIRVQFIKGIEKKEPIIKVVPPVIA
jgi:hypothetical protein